MRPPQRPAPRQGAGGQASGRAAGRPPQRSQTRLFTLADAEALGNPDVVTGTATLFSIAARILVDPGSNRSFVGPRLSKHADRPLEPLDTPIRVMTPLKEQLICDKVYRGCVLIMGTTQLEIDLIPLDLRDFDVIVGMDCLSKHRARVECYGKKVWFSLPDGTESVFAGDRQSIKSSLVSWIDAQRMMQHGCCGFLAHVKDTTMSLPKMEEVPVVCDFLDVFPEELPGLPPDREIKFEIELLPGTTPISITPYRMEPVELKELKAQLEELVERGFIRPSVSPWGAPVLFVKKKDGSLRLCIDYRQLNR